MARSIDRYYSRNAEIPTKEKREDGEQVSEETIRKNKLKKGGADVPGWTVMGCSKGQDKPTTGGIDMDWNVKAQFVLELVQIRGHLAYRIAVSCISGAKRKEDSD